MVSGCGYVNPHYGASLIFLIHQVDTVDLYVLYCMTIVQCYFCNRSSGSTESSSSYGETKGHFTASIWVQPAQLTTVSQGHARDEDG